MHRMVKPMIVRSKKSFVFQLRGAIVYSNLLLEQKT